MKNELIKPEVDDFWDDCIKETNISSCRKLKKSSKLKNRILNMDNSKKKIKQKINKITNSKILIKEALEKEKISKERKLLEQKLIETCNRLYSQNLESKEMQKNKNQNSTNYLDIINEQECTFKPKMYSNSSIDKKINKEFGNLKIYDRGIKFQQKHYKKLASLVQENNYNYDNNYDFHPFIENKNIEKVLYYNSSWLDKADNDSNKLFLLRYMKAREQNMNLKNQNRQHSPSSGGLKYNWSYPKKIARSISQKDSLLLKKTLHNNLLNIKDLDDYDENKDINMEQV